MFDSEFEIYADDDNRCDGRKFVNKLKQSRKKSEKVNKLALKQARKEKQFMRDLEPLQED